MINRSCFNIYYFKYCLDAIYNFSNLSEYYSADKENIEKLIKELDDMDKTSFGITKIEIIEYMNNVLRKIQTKLQEQKNRRDKNNVSRLSYCTFSKTSLIEFAACLNSSSKKGK